MTHAQLAALTVRTAEALDVSVASEPDEPSGFTDLDGLTLRGAVERAVVLGTVEGVTAERFEPTVSVRRDQAASMIARLFDRLVAQEVAAAV